MRPTFLLALSVLPAIAAAQNSTAEPEKFVKSDLMVPMRDGVRLHTLVFTPKDSKEKLPILFERTPYGARSTERALLNAYQHLASDGYIFAFQDIRGRFKSEGEFVMQRPPRDRRDAKAIDESTDAYDTIEWMLKNVSGNNGRVGILGISYGGWLTTMALLDPHPALKAASEQASPADMFLGDDFHHNGAFRLSYGFEFDRADTFQWYLDLGVLSNANERYFHNRIPTWNDFVNHPNYDRFWQQQAFAPHIGKPVVPNL